ncbi:MAG: PfkB family carbohydrate kinase, partial [Thermoproteota archaeon]
MFTAVAVGNPVYDIIKTPFIESLGRVLSGCSVNAALTMSRLGMKGIAIIGCIGHDYEEQYLKEMEKKSVTPIIVKKSRDTTGFKLTYLDFSGNRKLKVLGVSDGIASGDLPQDLLSTPVAIIGPVIGEVGPDVPAAFKRRGAKVFLDPQGLLRRVKKGVVEHYSNPEALEACCESHVVKPNELEAKLLSGVDEPLKAAIKIHRASGAVTALTLAEKGSIIVNNNEAIIVPAYPTYLVDPTGAGDVYLGSLVYYLHMGLSLKDAAAYASARASIKVENLAGHFSLRTHEVERRASWIK